MRATIRELCDLIGGHAADADTAEKEFTGLASLADAGPFDVAFYNNDRYADDLASTKAGALLVQAEFEAGSAPDDCALITVEDASKAFSQIAAAYFARPVPAPGVHPTAFVAEDAKLDRAKVAIGPNAIIESGAEIGDGSRIDGGAFVGRGARVGKDCTLYANATIHDGCLLGDRVILHSGVVVGSDGYGFDSSSGEHVKIEQLGIVQIDDDVEIGSNTSIDRARFGKTHIGEGTKVDNLVQIAHNVVIGKRCLIVAQAGIAGSTHIEDGVVVAAQVGIAGHLRIGSGVILAAQSGVAKSITEPGTYMGFLAVPGAEKLKQMANTRNLPKLIARVKELEKEVRDLRSGESKD
ncbi:MAG: UDP-3-O-(3-hydroxymyristoyl)glucosamine N-acyltransferase [Verrucomicrobiota bacterium]